jgi:hypothetical protein
MKTLGLPCEVSRRLKSSKHGGRSYPKKANAKNFVSLITYLHSVFKRFEKPAHAQVKVNFL